MKCQCCNGDGHNSPDRQGERGLTTGEWCQLYQLSNAGLLGVEAGNLIDKEATRELVRRGYADNTGGAPSSLSRVYVSKAGRAALTGKDKG
jgi:hypothetical protein